MWATGTLRGEVAAVEGMDASMQLTAEQRRALARGGGGARGGGREEVGAETTARGRRN